ncbi:MAG: hypothetical protein ABIY55_29360 [Kofleriaceae bacterium]
MTADDMGGRLWDATSGRLIFNLGDADRRAQALFSPDGATVVTIGSHGFVKVWDVTTGVLLRTLTQSPSATTSYRAGAISPDGKLVAAIDNDGSAYAWDTQTGAALAQLSNEPGKVPTLAFSHDGRWLATRAEMRSASSIPQRGDRRTRWQ